MAATWVGGRRNRSRRRLRVVGQGSPGTVRGPVRAAAMWACLKDVRAGAHNL